MVPGTYVKPGSAHVGFDAAGQRSLTYALTGQGIATWCTFTSTSGGTYSAIVLDNRVLVDPTIESPICGGRTQITGLSGTRQTTLLAIFLNYGALPVALHVTDTQ